MMIVLERLLKNMMEEVREDVGFCMFYVSAYGYTNIALGITLLMLRGKFSIFCVTLH
jgi:hypothetical protein